MLGIRPGETFIQTILPHGLSLPKVPKGIKSGSTAKPPSSAWTPTETGRGRQTGAYRTFQQIAQSLDNQEHYQRHSQTVDDHSKETVGGVKTIEALGAVKLLSGGSMSVAAVDDLHQATGRDLNLVVGDKYNATVGGDMQERIEGLRKSVAGDCQRLVAPKNWIGSESVNLFQVVCDLLNLVQEMNTQLAGHTHLPGPTPSPTDAAAFIEKAEHALKLGSKLNAIIA